jgi:hypothetical protein
MSPRAAKRPSTAPAKGLYANYFEVGHTAFEVVIDFGQRYAGKGGTPCHTRIVTSPVYAEALLRTLSDALDRYRDRVASGGGETE